MQKIMDSWVSRAFFFVTGELATAGWYKILKVQLGMNTPIKSSESKWLFYIFN